jgi:hypothetical protein
MSNKKQTSVEWLESFMLKPLSQWPDDYWEQAKEMENKLAHEYAEFAIRCDRMGMKILNFEDWIKL